MNDSAPNPSPIPPPAYWPWLASAIAVVLTPVALLFGAEWGRVGVVGVVEVGLMFYFAFLMRVKTQ